MDDLSLLPGFREYDGEDALRLTLDALARLMDPPAIDPERRDDRDYLTDVLLDQFVQMEPMRLLSLLTALQSPLYDVAASQVCAQEHYLLDPRGISDECVLRTFTRVMSGQRKRPFVMWAMEITRDVVRHACRNPETAPFVPPDVSSSERLVMLELGRLANALDFPARRVVHLAWVERIGLHRVADVTGTPLERVEHILASVLDEAKRIVRDAIGEIGPPRDRTDPGDPFAGFEGAEP